MLDRKYERQMSGKEKRKFEAEKMSQMTLRRNWSICGCTIKYIC